MMLVDTHAHIHFDEFAGELKTVFDNCRANKVSKIITVGVNELDSAKALAIVSDPQILDQAKDIELFASAGLHPHEAKKGQPAIDSLRRLIVESKTDKLITIGECGLDYYRNLSPPATQQKILRAQIELALEHNLPVIFHVRDAWSDFFTILKDFPQIRGVIHSFTGGPGEVARGLKHNLHFGLNGIITFTKVADQIEAAKLIPDENLLLETDSPFLAPAPQRGQRNQPANVRLVAEFLAYLRGQNFAMIVKMTTQNAIKLFKI